MAACPGCATHRELERERNPGHQADFEAIHWARTRALRACLVTVALDALGAPISRWQCHDGWTPGELSADPSGASQDPDIKHCSGHLGTRAYDGISGWESVFPLRNSQDERDVYCAFQEGMIQ